MMVDWPLASVTVPTVSADAAPGLLFARKVKVPVLKVRFGLGGVGESGCVELTAVLSSVSVPPWSMVTALVAEGAESVDVSERRRRCKDAVDGVDAADAWRRRGADGVGVVDSVRVPPRTVVAPV